ncbi:MAG TPA: 30S ribosomal protein S17 [Patescibacteria group bacterium]|jgi:small subunit ribosomal protein S17|nr:30S ribosomal protein S17 [Patescibacteria group bacterium]
MTSVNQNQIKRVLVGEVISHKMNKTIVVKTVRIVQDSKFHKVLKKIKKYLVHDEQGIAKSGDMVEIYEGRPKSKLKYMYLSKVVRQNLSDM